MLEAIEKMRDVTKRKLSAQPNGGLASPGRRPNVLYGFAGVHGQVRQAV
jgi:hypothetical protein